jgi:predicted nucleic acid-binding protein
VAVLIDTGVLYALYDTSDSHHLDSVAVVLHALEGKWGRVFVTNYISLESTLLINARLGPTVARALPKFVQESGVSEIVIEEDLHKKSLALFLSDDRLSLTDAATTVLVDVLNVGTLATFDVRSFSKRAAMIKGAGYWEALSEEEKRRARTLTKR